MSFYSARQKFETAKSSSQNQAMDALADGLMDLARAIEQELHDLKREVDTVKSRVNSIRNS